MFYMMYILENYESDPNIKNLIDNLKMYFVPVANPDGLCWNGELAPNDGALQSKKIKSRC